MIINYDTLCILQQGDQGAVNILKGIFGAMCTPFQENGEGIDLKKYYSHIDDLLEAGVHGLVLCSGTGEYAYLTDEEKQTRNWSNDLVGRVLFLDKYTCEDAQEFQDVEFEKC